MRKTILLTLALMMLLSCNAYALDKNLFDMRNRVFEECKEIKLLLPNSQDAILLVSMWDTCLIATMQLDAYFSMLGIFNKIRKQDLDEESINYIATWLGEIKSTNELNIRNLGKATEILDQGTKLHIEKLKTYFSDMNSLISAEYNKTLLLKRALKRR